MYNTVILFEILKYIKLQANT